MFVDNLPYIFIMLLCLVLSWFFSAAEVAYEQLNKNRIRLLAEKGGRRAGMALKLSENEDKLATTILVGDTAADVTLTVVCGFVMTRISGGGIGALWAALISGALLLLVGEVIPKHIAAARPERTALLTAPFLKGFAIALSP
ncbi:MAG: DUF21 domain-containing protein, partial [Clostridia bacterium]|nr:DUF21 domain-containing protein [Clostridia bacterium]